MTIKYKTEHPEFLRMEAELHEKAKVVLDIFAKQIDSLLFPLMLEKAMKAWWKRQRRHYGLNNKYLPH